MPRLLSVNQGSFIRINRQDWMLPGNNQSLSSSVFLHLVPCGGVLADLTAMTTAWAAEDAFEVTSLASRRLNSVLPAPTYSGSVKIKTDRSSPDSRSNWLSPPMDEFKL